MYLNTKKLIPLDKARQPQTLAEYSPDGKKIIVGAGEKGVRINDAWGPGGTGWQAG